MTAKPKILPPDLPVSFSAAEALDDAFFALLAEDEDIEATHFTGVTFAGLAVRRAVFRGCRFEKCAFLPGDETRFDFLDCSFHRCDFAGMTFTNAVLHRVELTGCRGVGMYMADASLRSVVFDDCQLGYANFGLAKMNGVAMRACDLSHAGFGEAQFKDVSFTECKLSGAELFGTALKGMDLRSNAIDGIVLGTRDELVGAKVTPLQACDLAALLGVIVEAKD